MAFERPTLAELVDRIEADFISRLSLTGAVLRRAVVYVLARVIAGAAHMLHGHLEFLGRQLFPDLSEDTYLVRQAALFGIAKTSPGFAQAEITITGTDATVIPIGTVLLRSDGAEYTTDAQVTITSGTATADVTSSLAGADYTLEAGAFLSFESPIAGADSTAEVDSSTVDGTDEETTEALRVRLLARLANPAHGGNEADLIAFAKSVAGVTRAWVYPEELGAGTVVVRIVRDDDASLIPSGGEVAEVQAVMDEEAPVHMTVTVVAPVAAPTAFTLHIVPDTADTQAAVEAELADLLLREGEPGGPILLSAIRTAIGTAAGITDYTLAVPAANVTHTTNQIPTLGTVTFT